MRFQNLQGWLLWLESCHPSEIELGLERVGQVAERLAFSFTGSKLVSVAGTNGKGSCICALNSIYRAAGYSVGCYTSPHLQRFNERISLDDRPIDDDSLMHCLDLVDQARGDISLTYFEYTTLAALQHFSLQQPAVILLEVGLGGRLDAVNIIEADVAIVSSIDLDHQSWLGDARELIGTEKAGIFRSGRPAVCADRQAPSSIARVAEAVGADLYQIDEQFNFSVQADSSWLWQGVDLKGKLRQIQGRDGPQLAAASVAAAIQASQLLGLELPSNSFNSLQGLSLTGRFQPFEYEGRSLLLDVAHNPAAASYLADRIATYRRANPGRLLALSAVMADKDVDGIVAALSPHIDAWMLADIKSEARMLAAADYAESLYRYNVQMISVSKSIRQALRRALSLMGEEDTLLIFGSFVTVGAVLNLIADRQQGQ